MSGIQLTVEPTTPPVQWKAFLADPVYKYGIALDGFVHGRPMFDPKGPKASFNHHEEVSRLDTRATCAQVLMAIRQGLFETFRDENGPRANVFVNDCDEDVCTAWALLNHHYLVEGAMNPAVNRLVAMEDMLDATAGAYPFPPDLPILRELAWVFEPYRQFRLSGQLDKKDARSYEGIITDVENRILRHVTGQGKSVSLDTRFERIGGGKGWAMVRELGAQARTGIFAAGIRTFVSVRDRPGGGYTYVIGKMSPFIPLDLKSLCFNLNLAEGSNSGPGEADPWGGAEIIIGSPRVRGSKLSPEQITEIMNKAIL